MLMDGLYVLMVGEFLLPMGRNEVPPPREGIIRGQCVCEVYIFSVLERNLDQLKNECRRFSSYRVLNIIVALKEGFRYAPASHGSHEFQV